MKLLKDSDWLQGVFYNNNNLLARVIQQYNDQYKKHSKSITVPNWVVAIC